MGKRIKLSTKIFGSFGLVLMVLIFVVFTFRSGLQATTSNFVDLLKTDVELGARAEEIQALMLSCRRNEKDFLLRQELSYAKKHAENLKKLVEVTVSAKQLAQQLGLTKGVEATDNVLAAAQTYGETFGRVVAACEAAGLTPESGLQGEFRKAAHQLEAMLKENQAEELYLALLMLRRYEKDFLLNPDDRNRQAARGTLQFFRTELQRSSVPAEAREWFARNLQAYSDSLEKLFKAAEQSGLASGTTSSIASQLFGSPEYAEVRRVAHDIEQKLNSLNVSASSELYLSLRRNEKDYLLRHEDHDAEGKHSSAAKYASGTFGTADTLRGAYLEAKENGLDPKYPEQVQKSLDTYVSAFRKLVETDQMIDRENDAMVAAVHRIEPLTEALAKLAKENEVTETAGIKIDAESKILVNSGIGITAVIFGLLLASFLTGSISTPIITATEAINESANQITSASSHVSSSSPLLASGASEQAASLEETSASMNEIATQVEQTSGNTQQSGNYRRRPRPRPRREPKRWRE